MKYMRVNEAGTPVIKFGDVGDTFYIIVSGKVSVYVPHE